MSDNFNISVGTDIVEISRIGQAIARFGRSFLEKIFTASEIEYCSTLANHNQSFAARFAAKEAFSKALEVGIGKQLGWRDVSVQNTISGKPTLILSPAAQNLMKNFRFRAAKISLSHTKTLAQAVVILIS